MCDNHTYRSTHIFMTKFAQNLQLAERPHTGEHRLKSIRYLLQCCWATRSWVLNRPININYTHTRAHFSLTNYSPHGAEWSIADRSLWFNLGLGIASTWRRFVPRGRQEVTDNRVGQSAVTAQVVAWQWGSCHHHCVYVEAVNSYPPLLVS